MATLIDRLPFFAECIQQLADSGHPGFAKLASWNVPRRLRKHAVLLHQQRSDLLG
jgi:hypothetical protein